MRVGRASSHIDGDVIEFTPSADQYAYTFGGAAPVLEVPPGSVLRLWSEDAFNGKLQSTEDKPSEMLNMAEVNPQTGPFFITGAEPGDTLAVHVVDLEPARDWGASSAIPLFGGLTSTPLSPTLQDPLPEATWIYQVDAERRMVRFDAVFGDFQVDLPLAPMLGTIGVAPPSREVRTSLVPGSYGGNMDSPEIRPGATCYFAVNTPGALFSIGDGHYRQGEGEACGTAVEGAMNSTVIVDLLKTGAAPAWPRIETDDALMVIGSARPLEDAWRIAQFEMVNWISELYGLAPMDAYQLVSQISLAPLANVVDTNYSSVVKVEKHLLPAVRTYGGMHDHLRDRAAQIRATGPRGFRPGPLDLTD
ncbi:acetamidase/formamidase family protein [Fodinicola feengrottensis]|uniref:Acetamidase/formamidase family protein n=1 Tax=Fodinicola feengrottensis TaxID=435914 RepID=A0ABP4SSK8_9ACTN